MWIRSKTFFHVWIRSKTFFHMWITSKTFFHMWITSKTFFHMSIRSKTFFHLRIKSKTSQINIIYQKTDSSFLISQNMIKKFLVPRSDPLLRTNTGLISHILCMKLARNYFLVAVRTNDLGSRNWGYFWTDSLAMQFFWHYCLKTRQTCLMPYSISLDPTAF